MTFRGRSAVLQGFGEMFRLIPGGSTTDNVVFSGDRAYAEWSYKTPPDQGEGEAVRGVDIMEFRDGRVCRKEAFRKTLAAKSFEPAIAPGPSASLPSPYVARRFAGLGVWSIGEFRIKAYGITREIERSGPVIAADVAHAAKNYASAIERSAHLEGGHFNLGFVILHEGQAGTWLLMGWWAQGNSCCQLLAKSEHASLRKFERVSRPLAACVWEALPFAHERDAWVRHMMREVPNPDGYLADWMPEGLH
jgi:hypothetical protein